MKANDFQARITDEALSILRDIRDQNQLMFDYVLKSGISHPSLFSCAVNGWERTIDVLDKLEWGTDPKEIENGAWSKYGHRRVEALEEIYFD